MPHDLSQSLDSFIGRCTDFASTNQNIFTIEYDAQWPSPCYRETASTGDVVTWRPVRQAGKNSFAGVEKAMDMPLHRDFIHYFTRYYSFHLPAKADEGNCELLQVCSDEDFVRLQENLIGHLLMKKRLKQPPSLFFALTDDDDYLLALNNDSGEVLLERVGKKAETILAPSLAAFLNILKPR